ncbi:hypothetical protein FRC03_006133 [Tulasnella sp. 419]|nr:hypothetical protein FRC03_006133 [Tulasnella sp. 419]
MAVANKDLSGQTWTAIAPGALRSSYYWMVDRQMLLVCVFPVAIEVLMAFVVVKGEMFEPCLSEKGKPTMLDSRIENPGRYSEVSDACLPYSGEYLRGKC